MKLSDYPVHNMVEMVLYFQSRGVNADKIYNKERDCYEFILSKGAVSKRYVFVYPLTDNYEKKYEVMSRACERMYNDFGKYYAGSVSVGPNAPYGITIDIPRKHHPWDSDEAKAYIENDIKVTMESLYPSVMTVPRTLTPTRVIFNDPATIVFWNDGTKTIVKCSPEDIYDPEKGLAMAFSKKMFGNDNTFHKHFKKWLPEEEPQVFEIEVGPSTSSMREELEKFQRKMYEVFGIGGKKQ